MIQGILKIVKIKIIIYTMEFSIVIDIKRRRLVGIALQSLSKQQNLDGAGILWGCKQLLAWDCHCWQGGKCSFCVVRPLHHHGTITSP